MGNALEWHSQMRVAPRLTHTDGMVAIQLGERVVVFPSEADARFFFEAYRDVPNLVSAAESLRAMIDEGALHAATARADAAETRVAALEAECVKLRQQLAAQAKTAAAAARRARILAHAIRNKITP